MEIPAKMKGHWSGTITDSNREKTYPAEIVLSENHVEAKYDMARGAKQGTITFLDESDGFLMLKETNVGSWNGTLLLYLDREQQLNCIWKEQGKNSVATAVMTRIESSPQEILPHKR